MKVLAVGATGKYASLVVPALVEQNVTVRALVHDPAKAAVPRASGAAETVEADLRDRASLDRALEGVDGVFHITPAFAPDSAELGVAMVVAAEQAGVRRFVFSGVYHPSLPLVNHATTRPVEAALYASTMEFTVLQPAMYMQGLAGSWQQALEDGVVTGPWSERAQMAYVDFRDVAAVVALAFATDRLSHRTFELSASGTINRLQLAELFAGAIARPVRAESIDPAAVRLPPGEEGDGLRAMFSDYDHHGFHGGNDLVLRNIIQREPRTIREYIAELAEQRWRPPQTVDAPATL